MKLIKNSSKVIIAAAYKTRNMYKMSHEKYDKLVSYSITQNYRKAEDVISFAIATECRNLHRKSSAKLNPEFITIEDHKENFSNNTKMPSNQPNKSGNRQSHQKHCPQNERINKM